MAAPPALVKAVEAAIVASAHLDAYEHLSAASHAVQRLGSLSSGRWRSAARDLQRLEDDLQTSFADVARELSAHADSLGIDDEALWAAGDAAATLDLVREAGLEQLEEDEPAASALSSEAIFGVAIVEDPDVPDRGTTLVFNWPEPLAPAVWPWQASWISEGAADGISQELDVYEAGDVEAAEPLLNALAEELGCDPPEALQALRSAAQAVTRASLLAAAGLVDEPEDDEDSPLESV
jgi:hypothetical protein